MRPHQPREAVGGQHERVPAAEHQWSLHLDLDVLGQPQSPQDDVRARVALGLRRAEDAVADELGDERMVFGQLADLTAPDEQGAAVAHVREERVVIADDQRRERRAHRRLGRRGAALAVDRLVGDLDGHAKGLRQRLRAPGRVVRLPQPLDREATGHVAARVSTHPVGHDEQAPARLEERRIVRLEGPEEVLVARTHTADVREMRERDYCGVTGRAHQSALGLPSRASLDSTEPISARTGGGAWRWHDAVAPSIGASRRTSSPARSARPRAK